MSPALVLLLTFAMCLIPGAAQALPIRGLYYLHLQQTRAPALELALADGVLQLGYLPEDRVNDRLWYGSLRVPLTIMPQGPWWPGIRMAVGYHREQTPMGNAFQAIEYGGMLGKELPWGFTIVGLATLARSLNSRDTLPPLYRLEGGVRWHVGPSARVFAGYQAWQSPEGLNTGLDHFSDPRDFTGWLVGMDYQLGQLIGFSVDD